MVQSSRLVQILVIAMVVFSSLACSFSTARRPSKEQEAGLTVLAGSELKDLELLLPEIRRATGVKLTFQYTGTLEGVQRIAAGDPAGKPIDFAWFSNARYVDLIKGASGRIQAREPIMLSPVVLGVKESKARVWGWVNNPNVTWRDVAEKAGSGELRYAMTSPASSNSGFSALLGVASSLAGKADALQPGDVRAVSGQLKTFRKGQALTGDSSGWLADQYVHEQNHLDGMVNYESVLLGLNKSDRLREPLYLVYPKEGIITADYPLLLINPDQRAAYQKVVAYLRSPAFQEELMAETLRRPVNAEIALSSDFPTQLLMELPFPGSSGVLDQLLSASLGQQIQTMRSASSLVIFNEIREYE